MAKDYTGMGEHPPSLRVIREQAGWSIRQLGEHIGIDRTKISRWERGHGVRMIREAIKVAAALNSTVEECFSADE
jgi:transcriptional regulator with XRE-family HTH domain